MIFCRFVHVVACLALAALTVSSPKPATAETAEAANKLLVRSVESWQKAQTIEGDGLTSSQKRLELLESINDDLKTIVNVHSGSDLAVSLILGDQIGPLSLSIVKEAKTSALRRHQLALCVSDPTRDCAFSHAVRLSLDQPELVGFIPVVRAFAQVGMLGTALEFAEKIELGEAQQLAYADISVAMAKAGRIDKAQAAAAHIHDADDLSRALAGIVEAMAKAGMVERASHVSGQIDDVYRHRNAITSIINALMENGQFQAAVEAADDLEGYRKSIALRDISFSQVEAGQVESAWQTAQTIQDPIYLIEAGINIAVKLEDDEIVREFTSFARTIEDSKEKEIALRTIGIRTRNPELLSETRNMSISSNADFNLWFVAIEEIEAGLYNEAMLTAKKIGNRERRSELFGRLFEVQVENGMTDEARRNLHRLIPRHRLEILAMLWSTEGKRTELDRALQLARDMNDKPYLHHSSALMNIVWKASNVERLEEAKDIAATIPNQKLRNSAYEHIVNVYSSSGLHTEAFETLLMIEGKTSDLVKALLGAGVALK